jgi:hypothetical protein
MIPISLISQTSLESNSLVVTPLDYSTFAVEFAKAQACKLWVLPIHWLGRTIF